MDALKQRMATAKAGTGEVAAVLSSVTFQPRAAAFTSLIQAASKAKATEKALELFQCMQDIFGIPPNTFSSSALISALAKSGQWELAEFYFHDLVARSSNDPRSRPNTVTFSALLNAYEKGGQFEKALKVFQQQLDAKVDPDLITFGSLVSACERAGQLETAIAMLDVMHNFGLSGTQQMYNAVIAAAPDWNSALEVFLGMQCAMVEPTAQTLNSTLIQAAGSGSMQPILDVLLAAGQCHASLTASTLAAVRRATTALGGDRQLAHVLSSLPSSLFK
ncbi:Pentatricopeptide repeat-containing protein, mitochondrial [Auxenochlorella protothecoides]|uniref:Pentatricopeptide repeat-containing protein, mitochondrial n=1 Tax=Auxenochlorella protothecoides TaxID=3075 RepID=A0A087SAR7_AUXPR|nr:Pentatricopeptide repeat-containing protein, mitochondrial [Auxenochlorella protothecoides]KFM22821.1 Pentatricopeptide repeat-containing protein, mitochondrial [Auxenochlorella protothecoides]